MKELPKYQLDPRVKTVWRINDAIWITLSAVCLGLAVLIPLFFAGITTVFNIALCVFGLCVTLAYIVWLAVLPPIRFIRWRYEISEEFLDITKGIIWRKRYTIPFIRVQDTNTRQGPILRAFKLASVTVSTAAKEHVIPGLDYEIAEQLRDRAAELARLAREDV